ncbi:4-methyl-5(Beta-hydroxyethyl)-thiazole monophosphate synthesis protein [Roseburia sp. CAG:309]|nr:4-methyl-5(Beta-hydroxyethyl)-thiazole monophosphate synthesis protein [Roseburia sp. CAG:309]
MNRDGKIVAAICAAPSVLGKCGILEGKKATCYPGFEDKLIGAEVVSEPVVADGNVITSRGLGTSMEFGFELIKKLVSEEKVQEIREQIVFMYNLLK